MRVLTNQERALFENAFKYINRVASVEANQASDIRIVSGGVSERLPIHYNDLINEVGGMKAMNSLFGHYNKDAAVDWLIQRCFYRRIQPRVYHFDGLLTVNRAPRVVIEHAYVDESTGEGY